MEAYTSCFAQAREHEQHHGIMRLIVRGLNITFYFHIATYTINYEKQIGNNFLLKVNSKLLRVKNIRRDGSIMEAMVISRQGWGDGGKSPQPTIIVKRYYQPGITMEMLYLVSLVYPGNFLKMWNWETHNIDKFWMNKDKFTRAGFEPATSGLTCRRSTN